ncbi:MAG TPA: SMI1/KNR4 family protein [Anaerolineaceae bacterium]|nr:SMI1/KNR4 family protein [Anaerolineaceae bacterium]
MRNLAELKLLPYGRGREYKKPTEKEVTWLGYRVGGNLPEPYQQFLMETNGGAPALNRFPGEPGVVLTNFLHLSMEPKSILWDTENILWNIKQMAGNPRLKHMLPIALDADGNIVLISLRFGQRGKVFFYRLDDASLTPLAEDFERFVDELVEEK